MEDHEYQHTDTDINIGHLFTEVIICPYCGYEYEYQNSREMIGNVTNAWTFGVECKKCSKCFSVGWDYNDEDGEGEDDNGIEFCTYHLNQAD